MKTVKTRSDKRSTYTYIDAIGEKYTLKPGDIDPDTGYVLTEADIQRLHRMDDREVENNLKNVKPPIQPWEKRLVEEWKKAHPYDDLPSRANVSLDAASEDDEGVDDDSEKGYLGDASLVMVEQEEPMIERLREVVEMLEPNRRLLFKRIVNDEVDLTVIAAEEGVTVMAIHNRMEKIKKFIKKNFWEGV